MFRRAALLVALVVLAALMPSSPGGRAAVAAPPAPAWRAKVDPWVLERAAQGETEFLVFLADQADLNGAAALHTKAEKGAYVYRTLTEHAEATQGPLRQALDRLGVEWQPFWVANMVWVSGGLAVAQALAERSDVAHISANPRVELDVPVFEASHAELPVSPNGIEWNISRVRADEVWAAGVNGSGVVIAGLDTGYMWTHNALKGKYRGWDALTGTASHDYNWHDAVHVTGSICGANSPEPCDDYGHGTHTMGTMVGDDGGLNQIGMAPGAKWIGCRNMNGGVGTPARYAECYQWSIAPASLDGFGQNSGMAPDVINNSWSCPATEGCTDPNVLLAVVRSVRAAGIVTVHSAGNSGSACGTVFEPAAIYAESFSVGALTSDDDGDDPIWGGSSRGPVTIDGSGRMKPNVTAPGVNIRSSTYTNASSYGTKAGTSMAAPHVAGLVALIIDANEALRGEVDVIENIIEQTAYGIPTEEGCGGDSPDAVPNNVYGWGRIDAYAAYQAALTSAAPEPVTDLALTMLSSTELRLNWSLVDGASAYHVWWDASPYFTPGASCAESTSCAIVDSTEVPLSVPVDPTDNTTWLVQPVDPYGFLQSTPSNRVAAFHFELVSGS